jgi:2,3-dimethylmalate lyase
VGDTFSVSFLQSSVGDRAARLRTLLAGPNPLTAPGCYDALGARLIEEAGFDVVYMTGFGTSASMLGRPDVGLTNQAEMVDNLRRIVLATSLPVIADADTGYGNAMNVIRTVQLWEQAGAAGFHLEDQVTPKKCGHMNNKEVISAGEAEGKIKAAVAARSNPNTVIIARTDARAVEGLDAAIDRAKRFADAGADLLFVEALEGEREIENVCERLRGYPLVFNWAEGGKTPPLTYAQISALGFKLIICPVSTLFAATAAMRSALSSIRAEGTPAAIVESMLTFPDFLNFIGLPEINKLEARFADGSS